MRLSHSILCILSTVWILLCRLHDVLCPLCLCILLCFFFFLPLHFSARTKALPHSFLLIKYWIITVSTLGTNKMFRLLRNIGKHHLGNERLLGSRQRIPFIKHVMKENATFWQCHFRFYACAHFGSLQFISLYFGQSTWTSADAITCLNFPWERPKLMNHFENPFDNIFCPGNQMVISTSGKSKQCYPVQQAMKCQISTKKFTMNEIHNH